MRRTQAAGSHLMQEEFEVSHEKAQGVSRREFVVQSGMLAGGALLGGAAGQTWAETPAGELPKRVLGRTGVSVTTLTLGTAPSGFTKPHNPKIVADCVNAAIDLGVNAIDTAPAYDVGEEGVGLALGSRRKEVFLSTKVMADDVAKAEKILANSLKVLKTDCVDLVYFHHVGDRKVDVAMNPDGVYTWLLKQKKAGKARFVGISGHNQPAKFIGLLESGEVDVLLTIVNFVDRYTYNFEEKVLPIARKHNVGIVAMKVFGGARKGNYPDPKCLPELDPEHLEIAVRYSLNVEGVATLDIGAHNVEQVRKDVELVKRYRPPTDEETQKLASLGKDLAGKWGTHFGPIAGIGSYKDVYHV
jgi:predicted aldo/keto reductase-like oxidoreductase